MSSIDRRAFLATTAAGAVVTALPAFAQAGSEDARLLALLNGWFEENVDESPERATQLGLDKGARAKLRFELDDYSAADKARRLEQTRSRVAALKAIDRTRLSESSRIDYDVMSFQQGNSLTFGDKWKFGAVGGRFSPYVISQQDGAYRDVPDFLDNSHTVKSKEDAEAYLSRLAQYPRTMDQELERMKAETAAGIVPPDFVCDLALGQMRGMRNTTPEGSALVVSLSEKLSKAGITGDYVARATKIVADTVNPALDRQIAAMTAVRATANSHAGVDKFKDGEDYYAGGLLASTTTTFSAAEIHQMGLNQVAEITSRIDSILKAKGMTQGSVSARLTALNNDPAQLYDNTDAGRAALIAWLNEQITALYQMLPQAFSTMPKAKVEVRRVPPFIQDGASNGYYQSAALDGSRPALYFINLKDTHEWPKYGLPTLTYHEALPGHHLQISLSQESKKIPILRRTSGGFSAFSEGWALYAEQLAYEMGVYKDDPLGEAGFWQSLLFRASRLVIDTGIHSKGWSREQATQYMVDTTGFAKGRSQREVERYCVSPGQACSYKVGHTVWVRLRDGAKAKRGAKWDIKAFHDAALLSGSMPMVVLERHINEWLATQA